MTSGEHVLLVAIFSFQFSMWMMQFVVPVLKLCLSHDR